MRRPAWRDERGAVLATSMILLGLMMSVALAAFAYVDTQQQSSASERIRETSFNLSESLLGSQIFILSRAWPGTASNAYPTTCTTGVSSPRCPDTAGITSAFGGPDLATGVTWSTRVRDNGGSAAKFYSDAITSSQPTYDANADGKLWVRAQASIKGRRRTLAGLVKVEEIAESFPKNVITAGKFRTMNQGRKVIVDTKGSSAQAAPLAVRCLQPVPACVDYEASKGQVSPDTTTLGYTGGNALSAEALDRLRERAIANGTYYATGCPANPSGALVFVQSGNCSYNDSAGPCCNSQAAPGVFIIASGTLSLTGNIVFAGVIYLANQQNSSDYLVNLGGTVTILGSVAIDGNGGLSAGASGANVVYDANVFSRIVSYGNAGIIQNTWREIPG
ncbi:MAG: hypothetical protein ACR2NH_11735 [Solirubrobacteraceae bacterium]